MAPALVVVMVMTATMVQPLATDLYLAALPAIRNGFRVPVSVVQFTVGAVLFSFGAGQLLWGPAADRFGRRPVLMTGFLLYAAGASIGALSPSVQVLIVARVLQGLGIAATLVCGRALVRDLFDQQRGTHVMSVAMSAVSSLGMLIPVLGAVLADRLGWRSTLWFMAIFGTCGLLLVLLRVPETARTLHPDALQIKPLVAGYARILRHPSFRSWTLLNSFGYASVLGFFSSSAYLFIETYGVPGFVFGLVIGGASMAYLIGTVLCRRWIAVHGIVHTVRRAGYLAIAAAAMFILPQLADAHTPVTLGAALWLILLAYGIFTPCGHVGMAAPFPLHAGAASALGGFTFASAAFLCVTWLGVAFTSGSSAVLSLTTGVLAAGSGLVSLTLVQRHGQPAAPLANPSTPADSP
jgi:DHA1 family bicyclomycin/chloramphenicol resistance-like MFS transporter